MIKFIMLETPSLSLKLNYLLDFKEWAKHMVRLPVILLHYDLKLCRHQEYLSRELRIGLISANRIILMIRSCLLGSQDNLAWNTFLSTWTRNRTRSIKVLSSLTLNLREYSKTIRDSSHSNRTESCLREWTLREARLKTIATEAFLTSTLVT